MNTARCRSAWWKNLCGEDPDRWRKPCRQRRRLYAPGLVSGMESLSRFDLIQVFSQPPECFGQSPLALGKDHP
jgi:hypothetical protein